MVVICCGVKPNTHQAHWAHHLVSAHGTWHQIPKQGGRYHGGPYHLNGVLVFWPRLGNGGNYPKWAIPMQGPNYLCKPWRGHWELAARLYPSQQNLPGQSGLCGFLGVAMVCGPGHPPPWAAKKDPLEWAQWVLLWLHSCWVGSANLDGMIFTQLECRTSSRTSLSVKVVSSSIVCCSCKTLSANWQGLPGIAG